MLTKLVFIRPAIGEAARYYGRSEQQLFDRLDALLMVSKSCVEDSCRNPWGVLFPSGQVNNLTEAMRSDYDTFFTDQPKVSFTSCIQNHWVGAEGPQDVNVFAG